MDAGFEPELPRYRLPVPRETRSTVITDCHRCGQEVIRSVVTEPDGYEHWEWHHLTPDDSPEVPVHQPFARTSAMQVIYVIAEEP